MPSLDDIVRDRLIEKYGAHLELTGRTNLVTDILGEIAAAGRLNDKDGYDKSYTEGYNKGDYSKADYSRYDKTNDWDIAERVMLEIRPELERIVLERLRAQHR